MNSIEESKNKILKMWNEIKNEEPPKLQEAWSDENSELFAEKILDIESIINNIKDEIDSIEEKICSIKDN